MTRKNYDSLYWALFTSFQSFISDKWYDAMYLSVKAVGWKCAFFYYTIILIGNVTLGSMFIAILLSIFMAESVTLNTDGGSSPSVRRHPQIADVQLTWKRAISGKVHPIRGFGNLMNPMMTQPCPKSRRNSAEPAEEKKDSDPVPAAPATPVDNTDPPPVIITSSPSEARHDNIRTEHHENVGSLDPTEPTPVLRARAVVENSAAPAVTSTPVPAPVSTEAADEKETPRPLLSNEGTENEPATATKEVFTTEGPLMPTSPVPTTITPPPPPLLNIGRNGIESSSSADSGSDSDTATTKVWDYLRSSSLFIFHKDWKMRQWLAQWVIPFDEDIYYLQSEYLEDVEMTDAYEGIKDHPKARASISQFIQSEQVLLRKWKANVFESIVLVIILLSIVVLIIWDPLNETLTSLSDTCNVVFTCAFALEAMLKIVAMDFVWPSDPERPAYLSSGWNILDLVVVITSIMDSLSFSEVGILQSLKVLRALRVLRPLKMMRRNEQLRVLVNSLIHVTPSVARLVVFTFFYVFSFGIIATFYFKGKTYDCSLQGVDSYTTEDVFLDTLCNTTV